MAKPIDHHLVNHRMFHKQEKGDCGCKPIETYFIRHFPIGTMLIEYSKCSHGGKATWCPYEYTYAIDGVTKATKTQISNATEFDEWLRELDLLAEGIATNVKA